MNKKIENLISFSMVIIRRKLSSGYFEEQFYGIFGGGDK